MVAALCPAAEIVLVFEEALSAGVGNLFLNNDADTQRKDTNVRIEFRKIKIYFKIGLSIRFALASFSLSIKVKTCLILVLLLRIIKYPREVVYTMSFLRYIALLIMINRGISTPLICLSNPVLPIEAGSTVVATFVKRDQP